MAIIVFLGFLLILLKLSWDDGRTRLVHASDLVLLNLLGLYLFQMKGLGEWTVMVAVILVMALLGKGLRAMGEGDVAVILAMGLVSDLVTFLFLIQIALALALAMAIGIKKARRIALPFVPFLSVAFSLIYLIRLRLIFS